MMKKKLILIFLFTFVKSLYAEGIAISPLQLYASQSLTELTDIGITKVGDLDLNELKQRFLAIQYQTAEVDDSISNGRTSAYYLEGQVFSTPGIENYREEALRLLALHESLGALGLDDENYQKSVLIESLSKLPSRLQQRFLNSLGSKLVFGRNRLEVSTDGGATGIGGGGDITSAWFKYKVIQYLKTYIRLEVEDIVLLAHLRFEPNLYQINFDKILFVPSTLSCSIDHIPTIASNSINTFHTIRPMVLVPVNLMEKDPLEIRRNIIETSKFFLSLISSINKYVSIRSFNRTIKTLAHCKGNNKTFFLDKNIFNNVIFKESNNLKDFIAEFSFECLRETGYEAQKYSN